MNVNTRVEDNTLFIDLEGRLDTVTSQQLSDLLPTEKRRNLDIDFNFEKLEYVSSAGLRVLVLFKKEAQATNNKMVIRNINDVIREIFYQLKKEEILILISILKNWNMFLLQV